MKLTPTSFLAIFAAVAALGVPGPTVRADVFAMPGVQKSLDLVGIGDIGNAADTTGYGAVSYGYQMGKYDVTDAQFAQFLNAVAKTSDPYSLYNTNMGNTSNVYPVGGGGITRTVVSGNFVYAAVSGRENFPVNNISWGSAARFANWLTNGQPTGPEGNSTTESGAYTLNGAITTAALMAVTRNASGGYVIPSDNEWYKAAYYKGGGTSSAYWNYATQSNSLPSSVFSAVGTNNANFSGTGGLTDPTNLLTPVGSFAGSPSHYGTFDQTGNIWNWTEGIFGPSIREVKGGCFGTPPAVNNELIKTYTAGANDPAAFSFSFGFRIAQVPEPASLAFLALAGPVLLMRRKK